VIQSLPFVTAAEQFAGPPIASVRFKNASSLAYEPLSPAAIATLVDHLRVAPFASDLVGFFPLGGAIATIDPAATAFPHRHALFDMQYQSYGGTTRLASRLSPGSATCERRWLPTPPVPM
jgi:hypothetical protein